jgi:hypothetical protein
VSTRSPEEAYRALQKLARADRRTTQQTFELYVHERFLARLSSSRFAERLVLKGGMLLAALQTRRATRDADMLARGINSDIDSLRNMFSEIAAIELADGVAFEIDGLSLVTIREDAEYEGMRAAMPARLAGAILKLRIDLSFGDPVNPQRIDYPTLLDDPAFTLLGYPLESVIAEKAETMIALADANTRDRDYGDIYLLSGIYPLEREPLRNALLAVAEHRRREAQPLGPLLATLRQSRQQPWEAFRARTGLQELPERFSDVVDAVVKLLDGLHADDTSHWNPTQRRWE